MIFSKKEKDLIESAVKAAERGSSGEIVPIVVASSGDYSRIGYRLSIAGFLIALGLSLWLHYRVPFVDFLFLIGLQVLGGAIGFFLGRLPALVRIFVGPAEMAAEVHEAALASFTRNGLHHTKHESGILVFVSLLEHRVEILADRGIHQKMGENFWKIEVQKLILGIREGRASETMAAVIQEMGEKLREHFPQSERDANELSDELRSR